ncbi:rhomboid family intramembrane serine protease [Paracidobacterium acidisoli]|uniref:Rhomboid family intramembrane serine protease n=1 Tax=Paracidobacterium acidisoli TaxID=2303751 RepID=A0A372IL70_9BACT|nr:rhomboid family intramembrane serine protease [Paracidobacterium acidisoli]MBT9332904.1 rhomboid family intramembrane serine protease [Paracidobacterium acidisoli]
MSDWNGSGQHGHHYEAARSEPEILPPGEYPPVARGWYPPPEQQAPQPRARRSHWASAPATYALVGINCAVFLAMLVSGGSLTDPTRGDWLFGLTAGNGGLVVHGQWWRLLTPIFVHFGWIHLLSNMWCLWNLGLLGEPLLGPLGIVAAYVLTGVAGNLLSTAVHPQLPGAGGIVSAGASGAVFGLAGVLIVILKSPLLPIPQFELKKLRRSVIYFALINFVIGAGTWIASTALQVDNMAHLGGFLSGLAFGLPLVPRIGAPRQTFERRRTLAVVGMSFVLLLLTFGVYSYYR